LAEGQSNPLPLLSDVASQVIRDCGILNDRLGPCAGMFTGIPYSGVYVTDERRVGT